MTALNPSALTGYLAFISLMIMKGSIDKTIRGAILDEDNAKSFMSKVQEQFVGPTKALTNTLITKLLTMRYDGHSSIRDHIMQIIDVQFILQSLPAHYDQFKLAYNTQKEKLSQNKLEVAYLGETSLGKKLTFRVSENKGYGIHASSQ
ncbi:hypothetical protein AMTRI_Chr12g237270 [Amborella trichopoda]